MPGKVKVKIIAGRNLPVMDRSSDTTDAYVEIKLGNTTYKTDVCRKSLNPQWNSEWYRFEVDDSELQDEPLQIRLMDHDTYSANDAIGKVYLNLNPLLIPAGALPGKYGWGGETNVDQPSSSVMSGWIPVYDTMHGIRGEVNVTVKVELFSDFNKFRQSSCGVQFFCSPVIPHGFHAQVIHGFIEELVVNDDPEYQWIDKIRTPRASNEARQTLFFKLSGELQRKIGVKALDLGGNAVIGYKQCFDLEGDSGIVARGIGTVVTLIKHHEMQQQLDIGIAEEKALSYLKFLAFDNGLKLENDNIFERFMSSSFPDSNNSVFVTTPDYFKEQLTRPTPKRNFLRQTSQPLIEFEPMPRNLKTCMSSRSLTDDVRAEIAWRQLLRQEEMKGSTARLSSKIRLLKQNMLYKKMNAFKTKVLEESLNTDTVSIISKEEPCDIRTSLIDLRELRKKKKQIKSNCMAEILVRSVIHAHTSLDCIVECHDSTPIHSTSTSALNEDTEEDIQHLKNESQKTALDVAQASAMKKTISEPYLLLPDSTIVSSTLNLSSESDLSSSEGSDSPTEIKDKLEFDTVSLIVKNVQDEEMKHRRLSLVHNFVVHSPEASMQPYNDNLLELPVDLDNKIEKMKLNDINRQEPKMRGKLTKALSRSHADIKEIYLTKINKIENIENTTSIMLPVDIEKRIEKLRHSALFKSIYEKPKNELNTTFSISCEDISSSVVRSECNSNENLVSFSNEEITKFEKKDKIRKGLSISCEEIYTPNLVGIEEKFDKPKDSTLLKSMSKILEPRKRGKLEKMFSISCDDNFNKEQENTVILPIDIEKRIKNLLHSPLFESNIEPRKERKMKRALSRSCADISLLNTNEVTDDKRKLKTNLEQKINMFKNSPLFKISILAEQKTRGKLNRELSKSHTDIATINKTDIDSESSSKSHPDLSNIFLVKQAMHVMLSEKINLLTPEPAPISPKASEELIYYPSNPDITDNTFLKNAMQTILMEKIDLMTNQLTPVSKRAQEEFKRSTANSISRSDPDISNHFIKSAINKVHLFQKNSPTYLRKSRGSYAGSTSHKIFNSDSNLLEENSVKSLILDKFHYWTSKPRSMSHKFEENILKIDAKNSSSHSVVSNNSLVQTAMETMLMEKISFLTPPISPGEQEFEFTTSDSNNYSVTPEKNYSSCEIENNSLFENATHTMLFDEVDTPPQSFKVEEDTLKSSKHSHLDKIKCTVHTVLDKVHILSPKSADKKFFNESESNLTRTAMQTMLLDKINIIAPDASENVTPDEGLNYDSHKNEHSKLDKIKTAVHIMCDKVSHKSPSSSSTGYEKFDLNEDQSEPSLMKAAMQTMLIDKVNILTPEASITAAEEAFSYDTKSKHTKHEHPKLDKIKEAVHTVIDKVSHMSPISKNENEFNFSEQEPSLMKNAMQTMLIDKMNIIAPDITPAPAEDLETSTSKCESKHENFDGIKESVHKDKVHHKSKKEVHEFDHSLTKTAMETMLLDKVNMIAPNSPPVSPDTNEFEYEPASPEANFTKNEYKYETAKKVNLVTPPDSEKSVSYDTLVSSKSDTGRKHSLFSTMKNKCRSLKSKISLPKFINKNKQKSQDNDLVKSAMTTRLLDRANTIQGILKTTDETQKKYVQSDPSPSTLEKTNLANEEKSEIIIPQEIGREINVSFMQPFSPIEPLPKACIKKKIDITLTSPSTEEPNIIVRPDTGDSCNSSAVTADVANCDTNAEHVPCLYTSDRRIVESPVPSTERERERDRENSRESRERHGHQRTESTGGKMSQSPARLNAIPCIHRRSSDSDLSITPKGNSLTGSDRSGGTIPGYHHIRSTLLRPTVDNFDMMEYPFLTMAKYPPGFILHLGGAVSARSVKLLERITNIEEPETRDTWWSEIRTEIRTHARALNCNAVLGYTESTSICDEVCVLSASGTAAVIALYSGELSDGITGLPNLHKTHVPNKDLMTSSLDRTDFERDKIPKHSEPTNVNSKIAQVSESPEHEATIEFSGSTSVQTHPLLCRICHIPYSESTMSFRINMLYCSLCKMAKVPDILLTTIEIPEALPITGRGCFLQSYVCRPKRDLKGELNAKEISESLPFLEYELHRLLVNKMKVKAMNTIFGLKVRITIGERMLIGIATGTAVFLLPLPPPPLPKLIAGNSTTEDRRLIDMQKLLVDTVKKNKEIYELKDTETVQPSKLLSDTEESDDEKSNIDLGAGNKESCVLEVDDSEDIEVINLLVEPRPPDGFHVVNTENVPGLEELEIVKNLQMFTQVWRAKIPLNQSASHFGKHFQKLLQSVYFKLRRMIPCALCDLQFRVDLPEPDEIQLTLLGMALGLGDPMKLTKYKRKNLCHLPPKEHSKKSVDDELIFSLEEDHIPENSIPVIPSGSLLNPQMLKHRQKSPQRLRVNTKQRHTPVKERHGVDITPLSYVPGGKIERYLGYLNFFFIRETTSIREGGGLSGFVHSFITEVLAIVRAHVTALGGNAMVAYFMTECVLYHNAHKNQGQCLINVGGDVVFVSYFTEDN